MKVFVKLINKGLFLYYDSYVDVCYKYCLVWIMFECVYWLLFFWEFFIEECIWFEIVFFNFYYLKNYINWIVNWFVLEKIFLI